MRPRSDTAGGRALLGLAFARHVFTALVALLLILPSGAASACLEVAEGPGAEESESDSCARSTLLRGASQAEGAGPPKPDSNAAPETPGLFVWNGDNRARLTHCKDPCPVYRTASKPCDGGIACLVGPRGPPLPV